MARGGRRVGAGRKPKAELLRFIDGNAGRRKRRPGAPANGPGDDPAPVAPPADLTAEELAVWNQWAPLALERRTLTDSTRFAFEHLCLLEIDRRTLRQRFTQAQRFLTDQEMGLRREHRALVREINARLKDFMLSPFGKEIYDAGDEAAEVDPLDAFTRRRPPGV